MKFELLCLKGNGQTMILIIHVVSAEGLYILMIYNLQHIRADLKVYTVKV